MTPFDTQLTKVVRLEEKLTSWTKALNDQRKHRPTIKCEWDRTFDAREKAKTELCRMDRDQYAVLFPNEPNDR